MLHRELTTHKSKSFFLFGPRQTGKTTLIKSLLRPTDLYINLLPQRVSLGYANEPGRFHAEVLAHISLHPKALVIVDEVQKVPALLDDVHDLIEDHGIRFALTGSSARKLRRSGSNLLAGRAYTYKLYPLTERELGAAFNLERALTVGCLPALWNPAADEDPVEFLRTYVDTYLREEIAMEGLVKDLAPFARFLDLAAANDGEIINFSAFARDCGVSIKTVQAYFQILEDTFLAFKISPWLRSARKRLVAHPKFFLFDPGVTTALAHTLHSPLPAAVRGRRFEQFLTLQIKARLDYDHTDLALSFWRTNTGQEVDLLLSRGDVVVAALEIKSTPRLDPGDLNGLRAFRADYPQARSLVVGPFDRRRQLADNIEAVPWREFLTTDLSAIGR